MKQRLFALLALLLTLCLLCGCSSLSSDDITEFLTGESQTEEETPAEEEAPEEDEPQQEMAAEAVLQDVESLEILHLAYQESYGLNPFTTVSLCNRAIIPLLYEPLYLVNSRFEAEPVLAAATEVSEDGKTTTITLRSGVTFHSGKALTAQDVVYSYEAAKASAYYGNRFYHIDTVEAVDGKTIAVTTDTTYENVALLLDFPIVQLNTAEQPVPTGTGPFVYDDSYRLEPYDRWWQESWAIPCVAAELTPCDTAADIRDQFEYNNVNLVWTDPNSAAYATFHNDSESWYSPTTIMQYIGFNSSKKALSNSAVRACLTYAIDRETIVTEDLGGSALAASLPASPLSPFYDTGLAASYDYDLEDFQALLNEAQIMDYTGDGILDVYYKGYAVPLEFDLLVSAGNTQRRTTADHIAEALNKLGFSITVNVVDHEKFEQALRYGNFDLYYGEMRMSSNFDLGPFFRNGGSVAYGGMESGTALNLCAAMLENSGNAYDLHKRVMDQGYLCPILFKQYTVYTTRGAAQDLDPAIDWVIH